MAEQERERKYTTVLIDTINQLQNDKYLELLKSQGKADFDDWKDYGVEILDLMKFLRDMGAVVSLVLGAEGTGKTVGGKYLDPSETVWMNADRKPLSFFGAKTKYNLALKNYSEPNSYEKVKDNLMKIYAKRKHERLAVFIMGHVDTYKGAGEAVYRERLRVLGKMATKLNIEGSVVHCYYTKVVGTEQDPEKRYRLITQNTGFNTARSPEGYWVTEAGVPMLDIPNNLQLVLDKIIEDGGLQ